MTKDFWERIDKLEVFAERANPLKWQNDDIICSNLLLAIGENNQNTFLGEIIDSDNAEYIAFANPTMILEMIEEMRKLQKEADWLADTLSAICHDCEAGCATCPKPKKSCMDIIANDWREAAIKTVMENKNV